MNTVPCRSLVIAVACLAAWTFSAQAEAQGPSPAIEIRATNPSDRDEAVPVAVPEPSAVALHYHQTGDWIWAVARFWDVAVPAAILVTGLSARMRNFARRVGRNRLGTVAVYVSLFLLIGFVADLPLRYFAGFVRQHAYGLSNQSLGKWLGDGFKGLAVDTLGACCFAWIPFRIIGRYPRTWWLILAALMVPFLAFVMLITPVWIDPLFNDFGPVENKALESKIVDLARRSGIDDARVFQVNKSVDTKTANAYVIGLFGSKRIVLWDTLLKNFDEREVLAVMGHEMGHYVLNHVAWGIALSSVIWLAGFFWADRAGRFLIARYHGRFGFDSLADVAATPLILVLMGLSSTVLGPVALAYSRHGEHEADRFSLELTHLNRSAARAFADFQRENLGVPDQTPIDKLWRASHPSARDRIRFANDYHPWREGKPLRYGGLFVP